MSADPYSTWDPTKATDNPDGLPDRAIVPLVETLRARGVVTLQSCAGHTRPSGTPLGAQWIDNGVLWVDAVAVDEASVHGLFGPPFERIQRCHWPFAQWEFYWHPTNAAAAIATLDALRPQEST